MSTTPLLITPGAGADENQKALVALEELLAPRPVFRLGFEYRRHRRPFPPKPPVIIEEIRAGVTEFAADCATPESSIAIGGRSFGGRMCSMAHAEGVAIRALVLMAYPLHTEKKPEIWRDEHFPNISVPTLFISGTNDPFATPDELDEAAAKIPARTTTVHIDGARHDLARRDHAIAQHINEFLEGLSTQQSFSAR